MTAFLFDSVHFLEEGLEVWLHFQESGFRDFPSHYSAWFVSLRFQFKIEVPQVLIC